VTSQEVTFFIGENKILHFKIFKNRFFKDMQQVYSIFLCPKYFLLDKVYSAKYFFWIAMKRKLQIFSNHFPLNQFCQDVSITLNK
jgi:hypothetical protein